MNEAEWQTRKRRIDTRLRALNPPWEIVRYEDRLDLCQLERHAVEEFPTARGPADYALFVQGRFLGIVEAKKVTVNLQNVLEQAKRYSKGAFDGPGNWEFGFGIRRHDAARSGSHHVLAQHLGAEMDRWDWLAWIGFQCSRTEGMRRLVELYCREPEVKRVTRAIARSGLTVKPGKPEGKERICTLIPNPEISAEKCDVDWFTSVFQATGLRV